MHRRQARQAVQILQGEEELLQEGDQGLDLLPGEDHVQDLQGKDHDQDLQGKDHGQDLQGKDHAQDLRVGVHLQGEDRVQDLQGKDHVQDLHVHPQGEYHYGHLQKGRIMKKGGVTVIELLSLNLHLNPNL